MILPISWKRRKGLSSFWQHISPSAKSPQSWTLSSPSLPSLLPTPSSLRRCPPSLRPPSQSCPLSTPASQPSLHPPTQSSPAAAPSSPPQPPQPARSRCPTWSPQSWRSLWICWQRQRWRRHAQSQRSTCQTPSTQLRTGSPFTAQPTTLTLSPCARPWWPAHLPALPSRPHLCLPSQRPRPSPPVASPTGEGVTAMTSRLTPSAHQPCWPFKTLPEILTLPIKHIFFMYKTMCRSQGYG